ncbi:MAG: OmpA family protein [Candidatus Lindowbacteria bacterium]|nr:OmpA family protein [Candidatus Lindowbacteria bacterium]
MKRFLMMVMAITLVAGVATAEDPFLQDVPADANLIGMVHFSSGEWTGVGGQNALAQAAKKLKGNPELVIVAEGHTDSRGPALYNVSLAMKRAKQVKALIAKTYGLSVERIHVRGIGERRSIATNKTAKGRAKNRRVEIYVTTAGNLYLEKDMTMKDAGTGKTYTGSAYPDLAGSPVEETEAKTNVGTDYPAQKKSDVGKF